MVRPRHRAAACPSRRGRSKSSPRSGRSPTSPPRCAKQASTPWPRRGSIAWRPRTCEALAVGRTAACSRSRSARRVDGDALLDQLERAARVAGGDRRRARLCAAAGRDVARAAHHRLRRHAPRGARAPRARQRRAHPGALGAHGREAVAVVPAVRRRRHRRRARARRHAARAAPRDPRGSPPQPRRRVARGRRARRRLSPARRARDSHRGGRVPERESARVRPRPRSARVAAPRPALGVRATCCTRARSISASCR